MDIISTTSINGITIRLTEERWKHIVIMHPSLVNQQVRVLSAVKNPDHIFRGKAGELLAVSKSSQRRYIVVVYKEEIRDGFIITAFETTAIRWLFKKEKIWSRHS